jgi:UDP:flavonoid glycosyltransferase YjiC (YdhE family)
VLLGAFGDPGHAFPMLALGAALEARGHAVLIQTWERWRAPAQAAGLEFAPAPEYPVWPPLSPYAAAEHAARETVPLVRDWRPDALVHDVLTVAPALAAEACGVPVATLVPHVHPAFPPGFPPIAIGARRPRTRLGARLWRATDGIVERGLEQGRREHNAARARLGLPPLPWTHTGLSRSLTLVATLPHLEYPRRWPPWARVVGPLLWEPPGGAHVAPPPGDGPVVLVAPSTAQDPEGALLGAALAGLAGRPLRVIAVAPAAAAVPANAVAAPWISYPRTMPGCAVVVTHGGHGTVARALCEGCALVVCPAGGDMAENAARVDWAGLGVRLPRRYATPRGVRLAVRRALRRPALRERARAVEQWIAAHDSGATASQAIESWSQRVALARDTG